jgi:hypothetical protein
VWYAFEVLQKHLFPYHKALRDNNPSKEVIVVEDNDPSHIKARKLLAAEINQHQIMFAPHSGNSPDFNLVETLQKYHNKLLKDYSVNITGAAQAVNAEAQAKLEEAWQGRE